MPNSSNVTSPHRVTEKLDPFQESIRMLDDVNEMMDWGFDATHCFSCGIHNSEIEGTLIQCGKCKMAYYCSMKCFNKDLPAHQVYCKTGQLGSQPKRYASTPWTRRSEENEIEGDKAKKSPNSPRKPFVKNDLSSIKELEKIGNLDLNTTKKAADVNDAIENNSINLSTSEHPYFLELEDSEHEDEDMNDTSESDSESSETDEENNKSPVAIKADGNTSIKEDMKRKGTERKHEVKDESSAITKVDKGKKSLNKNDEEATAKRESTKKSTVPKDKAIRKKSVPKNESKVMGTRIRNKAKSEKVITENKPKTKLTKTKKGIKDESVSSPNEVENGNIEDLRAVSMKGNKSASDITNNEETSVFAVPNSDKSVNVVPKVKARTTSVTTKPTTQNVPDAINVTSMIEGPTKGHNDTTSVLFEHEKDLDTKEFVGIEKVCVETPGDDDERSLDNFDQASEDDQFEGSVDIQDCLSRLNNSAQISDNSAGEAQSPGINSIGARRPTMNRSVATEMWLHNDDDEDEEDVRCRVLRWMIEECEEEGRARKLRSVFRAVEAGDEERYKNLRIRHPDLLPKQPPFESEIITLRVVPEPRRREYKWEKPSWVHNSPLKSPRKATAAKMRDRMHASCTDFGTSSNFLNSCGYSNSEIDAATRSTKPTNVRNFKPSWAINSPLNSNRKKPAIRLSFTSEDQETSSSKPTWATSRPLKKMSSSYSKIQNLSLPLSPRSSPRSYKHKMKAQKPLEPTSPSSPRTYKHKLKSQQPSQPSTPTTPLSSAPRMLSRGHREKMLSRKEWMDNEHLRIEQMSSSRREILNSMDNNDDDGIEAIPGETRRGSFETPF